MWPSPSQVDSGRRLAGHWPVSGRILADTGMGTRAEIMTMKALHGWGRYPLIEGDEWDSEDLAENCRDAVLTRGLGRSYGDASLPPRGGHRVACSRNARRLLSFDPENGLLRAQAGMTLFELNRAYLPRGWFVPVSPGTQQVSLGGMVAADVHGKNHHLAGCFGAHVKQLRLLTAGGELIDADEKNESELFYATLGGMGLTAHILEVEIQLQKLPSPWIWEERERAEDLDSLIGKLLQAGRHWPHTVAWADCTAAGAARGRGLLIKGRWAHPLEAPTHEPRMKGSVKVPVMAPEWLLNEWTIGLQNSLRFAAGRPYAGISHPQSFFYPLDMLDDWHLLYGHRGFTQYQCVLPHDESHGSYHRLMSILSRGTPKPFLCVIKDCGNEGRAMMSFPKPGISFALDFPVEGFPGMQAPLGPSDCVSAGGEKVADSSTQALIDELNELVCAEGGRIYLAKDAFTRPQHFAAMEARLPAWTEVRRKWDPQGKLRSALSMRLLGDALR